MLLFALIYITATLLATVMARPKGSDFLRDRSRHTAHKLRGRVASCAHSPSSSDHIFSFDSSKHATRNITDGTHAGRSYLVHLPTNYDNSKKHAVILSFHGNGGTSAKQEAITQLSNEGMLINDIGIIVVYPQASLGKGRDGENLEYSWQGAPYAADGVNDVDFTRQILDELTGHLSVDAQRIYATGKSNGGGFTNLLACTTSINTRFAAFATVSAALYPGTLPGVNTSDTSTTCDPQRVTPILISHGYNDTVVPYKGQLERDGSEDYRTPDIDEFAKAWASRNAKYAPTSSTVSPNAKARVTVKFDTSEPHTHTRERLSSSKKVQQFSLNNFGHCWPSKEGLDCDRASFDLTPANLLQFLEANPLEY
ncbi:hypothetical protein D9757_001384 [Collybiopsis confluens]|uniref:feruloyl esterase n=1 Tax=Collybiopsis confluens TaxID=2823264 RepID=A0A8H5MFZ0_9AGAR|nr:hypothetical protein D9757_001384 [Collybiopsis confluens]